MSLKQWHKHDPVVEDDFSLAYSRISRRSSTAGEDDIDFLQDARNETRPSSKSRMDTGVPLDQESDAVDPAMWQMWQEKEGDEDGSGDIAMLCGDLDYDKNCVDSRREFHADPQEGWVMLKSSDLPAWAGAPRRIRPRL